MAWQRSLLCLRSEKRKWCSSIVWFDTYPGKISLEIGLCGVWSTFIFIWLDLWILCVCCYEVYLNTQHYYTYMYCTIFICTFYCLVYDTEIVLCVSVLFRKNACRDCRTELILHMIVKTLSIRYILILLLLWNHFLTEEMNPFFPHSSLSWIFFSTFFIFIFFFCGSFLLTINYNLCSVGSFESIVECCLSRGRTPWFDIWAVEGNGLARKRSLHRLQAYTSFPLFSWVAFIGNLHDCFIVVYFYFLFVRVLIWCFSFRGGGFISLENLLYFARNFPVCYLFLFSPLKIGVVGERTKKRKKKKNLNILWDWMTSNDFFWHYQKMIVKFLISCITCIVVHVHWTSKIIVFYSLLI